MENPMMLEFLHPNRDEMRLRTHPSSPEFEFWMVRNPSIPQPNILSADELFVDGVLLPLDLVPASAPLHESLTTDAVVQENEDSSAGPEITAPSAVATGSRRWKDMFKTASKETDQKVESTKTNKKRERKLGGGHGSAASSAELNINIWPFSRSRSAGNGGVRPKIAAARKVSSAPCSRSNSGGESKSRKWPASPGRPCAGVPVGRSSPVWQVRRGTSVTFPRSSTSCDASESRKNGKAEVLKSCKRGAGAAGGGRLCRKGSGCSNDGSGAVNIFSLRGLFGKKVY